jgi:hypothetical protein
MDMRWGCSGASGRHRLAHGNPKRRIFSAGTGLRSMSYPHGSPRGGLTPSAGTLKTADGATMLLAADGDMLPQFSTLKKGERVKVTYKNSQGQSVATKITPA